MIIELLKRLVEIDPFDDVQGKCYWCGGGWEQVLGPRGGKGEWANTSRHEVGCAFGEAAAVVAALK